ncbi:hypothetical protein [Sediminimonas sp.]|uniref:portal protein n=1 Tax=Sediminimonas sp. TaxID=2823379 RepID=UPI0025D5E5BE|nr:hypothetical protein [Sediminimonas sp.]
MFENDKDDPAYAGQMRITGRKKPNDPVDRLDHAPAIDTQVVSKPSDLDGEYATGLWRKILGYYRIELQRQQENREEQSRDADFYDSIQWDAADKAVVEGRGQQALVFNVIATAINWLLGTEKRGRTDHRILPRKKDGAQAAESKTKIMKYMSDVNRAEFHVSQAFADAVKTGVGWLESGVQDDDEGEPLYERRESWRNMLWDSMAQELDLSDARYVFRTKWMDEDIAAKMFPKRTGVLETSTAVGYDLQQSMGHTGDEAMDSTEMAYEGSYLSDPENHIGVRNRIRMIEAWFRVPTEDHYLKGGQFAGELFDKKSRGHMEDVAMGNAEIITKVRMRVHVAIFTEQGLVHLSKSPYRHNRFPFTPIWCYRRDNDNMPYGIIRNMRDPQSDLNKRASKALHILSTSKTIMDEGAVSDLEEFREEAARPDAVIVKKRGLELTMDADRELAAGHLDLMSRSISMIQQISGITDESMGRTTNATSGKAIIARQDQGALATAGVFDALRFARQIHGEKKLSLIEQFVSDAKEFRVTNMRGNPEYLTVNDGTPENDIVKTKADFIISEDDFHASHRQAQVEQLMEFMTQFGATSPEIVMATLDLVVETMDVPMQEELVKRIRQITGAEDPDADPENPDPETQQRKKMQEIQQQMQMRGAEAELADKEATAAEKQAKAQKAQIEAEKLAAEISRILAETAGSNVDTQVRALEAAASIVRGAPGLAGVADTVLAESGYQDRAQAPAAAPPTAAQPEALPPEQQQALPPEPMPQEQAPNQQPAEMATEGF